MTALQRIGILGTGLIGGSIGLRARSKGLQVAGFDRSRAALAQARELGCIDDECTREELYASCDLVVLAMPPRSVVAELHALGSATHGSAAILDVASVKAPVAQAARGIESFVGSHPMAGNEGSGAASADAALFEGRTWAYVPAKSGAATQRALALIALMRANAVEVDPESHDASVALTSHLPQIFAMLFARRLRDAAPAGAQALYGPVARELLRIGTAAPEFWDDVLAMNAKNIAREALGFADALERFGSNMHEG